MIREDAIKLVDKLAEKISSYGIINNIIPGAVYIAFVERFTTFRISPEDVLMQLVLCYFIGMVIGRIGSLWIEKKALKNAAVAFHEDYTKAEILDSDGKVTTLSTINNMYRTFISLPVCVMVTVLLDCLWAVIPHFEWIKKAIVILGCVLLIVIFVKSYKKQTGYVASRVQTVLRNQETCNADENTTNTENDTGET